MAAPSLCLLSLSWPLGPVLPPVCSHSLVPSCPPSLVPWSLALCVPALVCPLPPRHAFRGATREAPLSPPSPCRSLVLWFCLHRSPRPSSPVLPPPPSPALAPLYSYLLSPRWTLCRHVARMSQVRFLPLPSCPALPPLISTQLHARRRHAPGPRRVTLRGADLFAATRRGSPPCPLPLRIAGGSLGGGAPLSFRPTLALLCRRGTCPALLSLPLCPPASTSTMRSNSRGSTPSSPSLSALAPWPRPAPRLLALPRPLVPPRSLGHWPSVSLSPSSLHPSCLHFAEQFARHPSNSPSTLPLPGALVPSAPARSLRPSSPALSPPPSPALFLLHTPQYTSQDTLLACRMHVAGTRLAPPSPPCPVLSLHYAGHSAKHRVDTSHACRRHAPGLYWRRRWEGWLHAVTARRCRSPRGSRRRGQPLHMPRGARPW